MSKYTINEVTVTNVCCDEQEKIELVDWVLGKYGDMGFTHPDVLNETTVFIEACKALRWYSIPESGGIEITWLRDGELFEWNDVK
jgi:hypothetical protein